jgi:autoinducer 2-degrading protein
VYHIVSSFDVAPDRRKDFIAAALEDRRNSATESGAKRFELIGDGRDHNRFYLDEAYDNEAAFQAHARGSHYARFFQLVSSYASVTSLVTGTSIVEVTEGQRSDEYTISKLSFGSFPPAVDVLAHFNGYAELRRLAPDRNASVAHVHFPPGVRTDWHRHEGDQLLWFIEGEGEVVLRDGIRRLCRTGDIVRVSARTDHWHGASAEQYATHIAITVGKTEWQERPDGAVCDGQSVGQGHA